MCHPDAGNLQTSKKEEPERDGWLAALISPLAITG